MQVWRLTLCKFKKRRSPKAFIVNHIVILYKWCIHLYNINSTKGHTSQVYSMNDNETAILIVTIIQLMCTRFIMVHSYFTCCTCMHSHDHDRTMLATSNWHQNTAQLRPFAIFVCCFTSQYFVGPLSDTTCSCFIYLQQALLTACICTAA